MTCASTTKGDRPRFSLAKTVVFPLLFVVSLAHGQAFEHGAAGGVPYIPTPQVVVDAMLDLAQVGPRDFVLDLGSGDGRLVLTAARKYGARGRGVELDATLVDFSNQVARDWKIADRVRFERADLLVTPIRDATVVTLYLLPALLEKLKPRLLAELRPGTRIVSHDWPIPDWPPERERVIAVPDKPVGPKPESRIMLWVVPARPAQQ
jgi:SAM-dependent methyltransferase